MIDAWLSSSLQTSTPGPPNVVSTPRLVAKPAVREVRVRGLMGAVELAPPPDVRLWGRRVSAAAVERGVLLRSIGDNVTLMPPLTVTSPELHRLVHALSGAIDEISEDRGGAEVRP